MTGQWLVAAAGLAALKNRAEVLARRVGRRAMLILLIGLLWLLALGFALAGVTVWLAGALGVVAALGTVAAMLAIAASAIHLGMSVNALPKGASGPAPRPDEADAASADEEATASDEAVLASALAVTLAGYVLGRAVRKS